MFISHCSNISKIPEPWAENPWAEMWGMTFNAKKYVLCGKELESIEEECDLGVIMSNEGNWFKQNIDYAIGKANKTMSWIFRNITSRSVDVLLPLYKSLIGETTPGILRTGMGTHSKNRKLVVYIMRLQRKFTKRIEGFAQLPYEERFTKLKLTTLLEHRARFLIETFKIINGLVKHGQNMFCTSRSGRNLLHVPYRASITKGNDIFKRRVIKYWNILPPFVKEANSTNDFKAKLELYKTECKGRGINNGFWALSQEIYFVFSKLYYIK